MDVLGVVAVVVLGLLVGVELAVGVLVNPMLDRLPGDAGLAARSAGARVLGRVMPFWYVGASGLVLVWAVMAWGRPGAAPVAVATGLLATAVLASITLLVPINDRVKTWSAGDVPDDWRAQLGRWDRLHHGRTSLLFVAFVLVTAALLAG